MIGPRLSVGQRTALICAGALFVVSCGTWFGGRAWLHHALHTPLGGPTVATIDVPRGANLRSTVEQLAQAQVLAHPRLLYYYARYKHRTKVGSGRYEVRAEQAPVAILTMLNDGRVLMEPLTIAEGLNRWQVRDLLVQHKWIGAADFDRLCDDAEFLGRHHVAGPSCEGYLFPDTYKLARGTPAEALLGQMFAAFKRQYQSVTRSLGVGPLALGEREFATLAAIVEKETGAAAERPRIACVFYNRLRARPPWKLQTDPTVIYAAHLGGGGFDGNLTRRHLHQLDSPYNTYRVFGLPPGPIANPGRAALEAVAQPALCKDYFFVSNNHGEHIFCPTLKCHADAVNTWQVDYFRKKKSSIRPLHGRPHRREQR